MTTPVSPNEPRDFKAEAAAAKAYAKAQRPWFKKKRWIAAGGILVLALAGAVAPQDEPTTGPKSTAVTPAQDMDSSSAGSEADTGDVDAAEVAETPDPTVKPTPELTSGQRNALEAGQNYIDMSGFSKAGLINQLSSSAGDGYSRADATYAANHVDVDWKEEAVEAAKNYLEMAPMSKSGLIEQLTSSAGDKFTQAQAEYAAEKVY